MNSTKTLFVPSLEPVAMPLDGLWLSIFVVVVQDFFASVKATAKAAVRGLLHDNDDESALRAAARCG